MDDFVTLLLWIHLASLAVGGAASFGLPVLGARMQAASPAARPDLSAAMMTLSRLGRSALATLWVTGGLVLWLRYGGVGGLGPWFATKMALVVTLTLLVILSGLNGKRVASGDAAAAARAKPLGAVSALVLLAIILTAVATFD